MNLSVLSMFEIGNVAVFACRCRYHLYCRLHQYRFPLLHRIRIANLDILYVWKFIVNYLSDIPICLLFGAISFIIFVFLDIQLSVSSLIEIHQDLRGPLWIRLNVQYCCPFCGARKLMALKLCVNIVNCVLSIINKFIYRVL